MSSIQGVCSLIRNSSQANGTNGLQSTEFLSVNIVLLVVTLVAVFNGVSAIVFLLAEVAILRVQRILLVNLVLAEILTAVAGIIQKLNTIVLISPADVEPEIHLCRLTIWINSLGISARMFGLTAYSLTFYLIVKFGKRRMKSWVALVMVIIVWLSALLMTVDRLIPRTAGVRYLREVRCFPSVCDGTVIFGLRIAFRVFWFVFVGLVPIAIAIVAPIIGYRKSRNGRTTSPRQARATRRLMAFLIAGTSATLLWMLFIILWPIIIAQVGGMTVPAGYLVVTVETIAITPTSLFILMYMGRVHQLLDKIVKCCAGSWNKRQSQSQLEDDQGALSYREVLQNDPTADL